MEEVDEADLGLAFSVRVQQLGFITKLSLNWTHGLRVQGLG